MFKWSSRLFVIIFCLVAGFFMAREYFPREITNTIIKKEIEQLPPEITERVLTDTVQVMKWRTKIVEKIKYREAVPETVIVYKEKVSPERFKALFTNGEIQSDKRFSYNTYSFVDSTISHFSHRIKSDHVRFWIDQRYGIPRVQESRDLFDAPDLELGWMSGEGVYAESEMRVWKLYPKVRGDQEGIRYGGSVNYEF